MIGIAPVLDNDMTKALFDTAQRHAIPFQTEVMSGRTGTNADVIAVSGGGVRTALVSIPLRYMHTPCETVSLADVENTAKLIARYVMEVRTDV